MLFRLQGAQKARHSSPRWPKSQLWAIPTPLLVLPLQAHWAMSVNRGRWAVLLLHSRSLPTLPLPPGQEPRGRPLLPSLLLRRGRLLSHLRLGPKVRLRELQKRLWSWGRHHLRMVPQRQRRLRQSRQKNHQQRWLPQQHPRKHMMQPWRVEQHRSHQHQRVKRRLQRRQGMQGPQHQHQPRRCLQPGHQRRLHCHSLLRRSLRLPPRHLAVQQRWAQALPGPPSPLVCQQPMPPLPASPNFLPASQLHSSPRSEPHLGSLVAPLRRQPVCPVHGHPP